MIYFLKKGLWLLVFCLVLFISSIAIAAPLQVIKAFESPGAGQNGAPHGLAWDGAHLWLTDTVQDKIFELTTNGDVVSSFDWSPCQYQGAHGLTWDGASLWNATYWEPVFNLDTNGNLISFFSSPGPLPTGLTWDGTDLWLSCCGDFRGDGRIYQVTTSGSVVSSFQLPSFIQIPRDLAYDGKDLWLTDQYTQMLYQITTDGNIVSSFNIYDLGASGHPYGLAWDGNSLWLSTESALIDGRMTDAIYQIAPVPLPSAIILLGSGLFLIANFRKKHWQ